MIKMEELKNRVIKGRDFDVLPTPKANNIKISITNIVVRHLMLVLAYNTNHKPT